LNTLSRTRTQAQTHTHTHTHTHIYLKCAVMFVRCAVVICSFASLRCLGAKASNLMQKTQTLKSTLKPSAYVPHTPCTTSTTPYTVSMCFHIAECVCVCVCVCLCV